MLKIITNFCCAKRLMNQKNICSQLHGYSYRLEISLVGELQNDIIINYVEAKQQIDNWLKDNWDHTVLLNKNDKSLGNAIAEHTGQNIIYFDTDPSTERMAEYLKEHVVKALFPILNCKNISLSEMPDVVISV